MVHGQEVNLLWGVLGELDTLLNVALESSDASIEEFLLTLGHTIEDVDSLLGTVGLYQVCQLTSLACNLELDDLRQAQWGWRRSQHRWP